MTLHWSPKINPIIYSDTIFSSCYCLPRFRVVRWHFLIPSQSAAAQCLSMETRVGRYLPTRLLKRLCSKRKANGRSPPYFAPAPRLAAVTPLLARSLVRQPHHGPHEARHGWCAPQPSPPQPPPSPRQQQQQLSHPRLEPLPSPLPWAGDSAARGDGDRNPDPRSPRKLSDHPPQTPRSRQGRQDASGGGRHFCKGRQVERWCGELHHRWVFCFGRKHVFMGIVSSLLSSSRTLENWKKLFNSTNERSD